MINDWAQKRLNEFVWFQRGFDLPRAKFRKGDVPVYGASSIIGYHDTAKVKAPGVITGRSGTLGIFQFAKKDFWPHNTSLWVKDFKGNDEKFVYYLLQCLDFRLFNSGGAVPTLNRNVLNSFLVDVPPLPTQRKIAAILSAYDDLIENNLRRIKLLEEMAQLTYEEWFVRMKFPGHEETPLDEETGLPVGWENVKLHEVIKAKNGKSFKGDYLDNLCLPVYGSNGIIGQSEIYNNENAIVIGRVGAYCGSIKYCKGKFWATDNTITASSIDERIPNYLAYFILQRLDLRNMAGGAAQPLLTQRLINNLDIVTPSVDFALQFNHRCADLFDLVLHLENQNQLLKEAHDILLPRLMTGMIDVDTIKLADMLVD